MLTVIGTRDGGTFSLGKYGKVTIQVRTYSFLLKHIFTAKINMKIFISFGFFK